MTTDQLLAELEAMLSSRRERKMGDCKVVPVADYEALQAECENLRKHLQNLIDQTTPLEPVPGNPMWSRRIQLDEVMAERESLRAECDALVEALEQIRAIEDELNGGDWDEIEKARNIANEALAAHRKGDQP